MEEVESDGGSYLVCSSNGKGPTSILGVASSLLLVLIPLSYLYRAMYVPSAVAGYLIRDYNKGREGEGE